MEFKLIFVTYLIQKSRAGVTVLREDLSYQLDSLRITNITLYLHTQLVRAIPTFKAILIRIAHLYPYNIGGQYNIHKNDKCLLNSAKNSIG